LAEWFLTEPCYNLVYLEAARCQIRQLPANLAVLIPNVRTLNLNFNFISDIQPLQGLARLRKLSLVGSHVQGTKSFIKAVRKMTELELVDFR
jgi:protein NUD1